jgi:hypothetical protein
LIKEVVVVPDQFTVGVSDPFHEYSFRHTVISASAAKCMTKAVQAAVAKSSLALRRWKSLAERLDDFSDENSPYHVGF